MTRDEIISMAREAGLSIRGHYDETGSTPSELERFAALVAAAEREACAKIAARAVPQYERFDDQRGAGNKAREIAAAIRARGEKGQS